MDPWFEREMLEALAVFAAYYALLDVRSRRTDILPIMPRSRRRFSRQEIVSAPKQLSQMQLICAYRQYYVNPVAAGVRRTRWSAALTPTVVSPFFTLHWNPLDCRSISFEEK